MSKIAYGNPSWMDNKSFFNINTPEFLEYVQKIENRLESSEKEIINLKNILDKLFKTEVNKETKTKINKEEGEK